MSDAQHLTAPAKVNLFLHVGMAGSDGRHPLDSLVVFAGADCADTVSVMPAPSLRFDAAGPFAHETGPSDDNLVWRAALALAHIAKSQTGADITLVKNLPVAAGIGGGSADAAATLHLLCDLWDVDIAVAEALAPSLGGDVAACFARRPVLMRGDGDRIETPPKVPTLPALLVNPRLKCPTGPVFAEFDRMGGGLSFRELSMPYADSTAAFLAWLAEDTVNDLTLPALALVPEIKPVLAELAALPNARLTRMSGSGATCFALFDSRDDAALAAQIMTAKHPNWWVRATILGGA